LTSNGVWNRSIRGISVAMPPSPLFADRFFRLPMSRRRPLQRLILEYLKRGGRPSVNAISTHLGVWRSSVQRSLKAMKREGSVKDQWVWFAPGFVPGIKAHTFHITDRGRRELKILASTAELSEPYPLGYRILLFLPDGYPVTVGWIAKLLNKDSGHIRRVMKSLRNKGLVDCLCSKTRTSFGHSTITYLYGINDLGRQVLDAGPDPYPKIIRIHKQLPPPVTSESNRMSCS